MNSLIQASPSSRPGSTTSSIPMTYSMDSDAVLVPPSATAAGLQPAAADSAASSLPPAYALNRSERVDANGAGGTAGGSFATTEDSIDHRSNRGGGGDRSVADDYTEDSSSAAAVPRQQQQQQQRNGNTSNTGGGGLDQYYQYQEMMTNHQHHQGEGFSNTNNISTMIDDSLLLNNSTSISGGDGVGSGSSGDATAVIHKMHKKLLQLLSKPEAFRDALDWQAKLDMGIDPASTFEGANSENKNVSALTSFGKEFEDDEEEEDEEEDSTFKGLTEDDNTTTANDTTINENNIAITHSENETFEFHPTDSGNNTKASTKEGHKKASERLTPPTTRKDAPLPHQIFASDAEVVLPQALTASQLFGIERVIGIELEAAAGITGLSQLFLRWLALMPEGDHVNPIDPPGLTVMKIAGGGYRVTAAHRVVWRWMNKFSPSSTSFRDPNTGKTTNEADFDFGDLVTMTIIDVFETDVNGKLLSYCPTFDNRAVHKTPEMAERIRKGASHLMERVEDVVNSPAGKSVNQAAERLGKMSFRAAIVVGNAVKNKIQHKVDGNREGALNELTTSQIADDDETLDINENYSSALDEDPMSSPARKMEV